MDGFRVYSSPYDSFYDHTSFLLRYPRYKRALEAETPEEQAYLLKQAGYATSPDYANAITNLINRYDLKQLDKDKPIMQKLEIFIGIIGLLCILYFVLKVLNVNF